MKHLILLLSVMLMTSCAPILVTYDYEKTANFESYKTYNYYSNINTGLSELDTNRLLNALDDALKSKGYTLSDTPDFFIDINSAEYQEQSSNNMAVGVGGTGQNVGGGISIGLPVGQAQLSREIVFEFIDEKGIGLFWQAVSESNHKTNWSPQKREEHFKAVVEKVLQGFPPEIE